MTRPSFDPAANPIDKHLPEYHLEQSPNYYLTRSYSYPLTNPSRIAEFFQTLQFLIVLNLQFPAKRNLSDLVCLITSIIKF